MSTSTDMKYTVWGGHGFVGSHLVNAYNGGFRQDFIVCDRNDNSAYSKNVINFVSTVDNYNVLNGDPWVDVDTNLRYLVDTLHNWRTQTDAANGCYNFISSWFVYGNINTDEYEFGTGVAENMMGSPVSGFYSITKMAAEMLVKDYCDQFSLPYRILRLGSVIGKDPKASPKKNAIVYMINQIKAGNDFTVWDTDGKYHRDFIHVGDCAHAIRLVLEHAPLNEIINIGNGAPAATIIDILEYVKIRTGSKSKIYFMPEKKERSFYLDVTKLISYGYYPVANDQLLYLQMFNDLL